MRTVAGALLWCLAMLVISLALAELIHPRPDPKPLPLPVTVVAETWSEVEAKGDRLAINAQQWHGADDDQTVMGRTVRTVRVVPLFQPTVSAPKFEPMPEPIIAQAPPPLTNAPDNQTRSRRQNVNSDVCAKHGMKRVEYDGGKRWRCAKK